MKDLIIVRGLPGSGKTTLAAKFGRAICSADDYVTRNGVYNWRPATVGASHAWSQRKCERFMKAEVDTVIVANTTTTEKEIKPYTDLAKKYGYRVFSIVVENRHGGTNVHDVPEETIEKMRDRFSIKL